MSATELLDRVEVARRLGVAPSTVGVWTREGRIPAIRLSPKVVRYLWSDVLRALREHTTPKGGRP